MAHATTHAESSKKADDAEVEAKAAKKAKVEELDPETKAVLDGATVRELEIIHHEWRLGVLREIAAKDPARVMARLNELRTKG